MSMKGLATIYPLMDENLNAPGKEAQYTVIVSATSKIGGPQSLIPDKEAHYTVTASAKSKPDGP